MEQTRDEFSSDLTLNSLRCVLRRPTVSDAERIFAAVSDSRFPANDPWSAVDSSDLSLSHVTAQIESWELREAFHFTVELSRSAEFVGQVSLSKEPEPRTWLLGYWLAPDWWGAGLATEAAREVLGFAFTVLRAESVWAGTALSNRASQRVLQKLGFVYRKENPCGYELRGKAVPTREYQLVRDPSPAA